ncbi:hypothetical protein [Bacillus sp. OAE603]|uniref:hypothetical protein n=1 Tax=Gottfriedia sp. OAE603 TaxID=2663872 RepID=UPI0017892345
MVQNKLKVYKFLISSSISTFVFLGINILLYIFDYFVLDNPTSRSLIGVGNLVGINGFAYSFLLVIMFSIPFIYITSLITYLIYYIFSFTFTNWSYKIHIILFSILFAFVLTSIFYNQVIVNPTFFILLFSGWAFLLGDYVKPLIFGKLMIVAPAILLFMSSIIIQFID